MTRTLHVRQYQKLRNPSRYWGTTFRGMRVNWNQVKIRQAIVASIMILMMYEHPGRNLPMRRHPNNSMSEYMSESFTAIMETKYVIPFLMVSS